MNIEQWWPNLSTPAKSWLIEHNGEPIASDILTEITDAGGEATRDPDGDDSDYLLADEQVDWIEELANDDGMS